jgi:hypothetical protein
MNAGIYIIYYLKNVLPFYNIILWNKNKEAAREYTAFSGKDWCSNF